MRSAERGDRHRVSAPTGRRAAPAGGGPSAPDAPQGRRDVAGDIPRNVSGMSWHFLGDLRAVISGGFGAPRTGTRPSTGNVP